MVREKKEPVSKTGVRSGWGKRNMFYVYVLRSLKDGSYYYGFTKELDSRLEAHNSGTAKYTKGHKPFVLLYSESFEYKKDALVRERFFNRSAAIIGYITKIIG